MSVRSVALFGDPNTVEPVRELLAFSPELRAAIVRPGGFGRFFAFRGSDVALGIMASAMPRVFAHARWAGALTLNWWIGTDTLETLRSPRLQKQLALTRKQVDAHLSVAPWISDELRTLGIDPIEIPIVPANLRVENLPLPRQHAVLCYAAAGRETFYGVPRVVELARRFPEVPFILCGGGRVPSDAPPNVENAGVVDRRTMGDLYARASVLVRLPAHDGLSKMVLEALSLGRHVLWSYPHKGVAQVGARTDAERVLAELFTVPPAPNEAGREVIASRYNPVQVAGLVRDAIEQVRSTR